jgi:hypothetical protein
MADKTPNYGLEYPVPADVLSEFPAQMKSAMEKIDTHTHSDIEMRIQGLEADLAESISALTALRNEKRFVVGRTATVKQVKKSNGAIGFTIPNVDPKKTVVAPITTTPAFCYFNPVTNLFTIIEINDTVQVPASGGTVKITEQSLQDYEVVYFTEE